MQLKLKIKHFSNQYFKKIIKLKVKYFALAKEFIKLEYFQLKQMFKQLNSSTFIKFQLLISSIQQNFLSFLV